MEEPQGTLGLNPRINTGLFSEYYLDSILAPPLADHTSNDYLKEKYLQEKWDWLTKKFAKIEKSINLRNEAQTRQDVIDPILSEVLGHHFDVEFRDGNDNPDYTLFASQEDLEKAKEHTQEPERYRELTIGLADAKSWKKTGYSDLSSNATIAQIHRYLTNHRRRWGFITNGNQWRLFAHKEGIRQDQFIEFNLKEILAGNRHAPDFYLFLVLFRIEAFVRDADGKSFLDRVLDQSIEQAAGLQRDLKEKVYLAFGLVAEEFRRLNKDKIRLDTDAGKQELKSNSLVFLYRILFLLYAESKLILPVSENKSQSRYDSYSLQRIRGQLFAELGILTNRTHFWKDLVELFKLIHGLDGEGNIREENLEIPLPSYNGGLFDPKHWPKLEEWKLGDKALKEVLTLLTRTEKEIGKNRKQTVNVSYRDLGVQHLGNIYEGILENQISVNADGKIEIVTDNQERKATGSYYTPDYIVDYIVKETIEPLLSDAKTREDVLKVKVLDPAMGSGHFLIGAIDFLAEELAKTGEIETGHPYGAEELKEARREIAERCIYGVDINPMAVELAKLSVWLHTISKEKPLTFLDNHIKWGNALIGARISDLNDLPDTKKTRVGRASSPDIPTKQSNLFPDHKLTAEVHNWLEEGRIFVTASNTIDDVKAKEKLEAELDRHRSKYRHLADLWTSLYFQDVPKSEASILYRKLADAIAVNAEEAPLPQTPIMDEAIRLAKEKRFFHWELEFFEIFFDSFGRHKGEEGGFDVVMGNPPYVRQETLGKTKEQYYRPTYSTYSNTADLYVYFYELGNRNLKRGGRQGLITSNKFIRSTYGKPLREFLKNNVALKEIIDFGELRVFAEAAPMPVVVVVANGVTKEQSFNFTQVKSLDFAKLKDVIDSTAIRLGESSLDGDSWSLSAQVDVDLMGKLRTGNQSLKEHLGTPIHYGIKTGFNEAFIIDKAKRDDLIRRESKSTEIIRPFVVGDDIRKYKINYEERYLIWTYIGVPIDSYPAIFEHLQQYQPQLEARQDQGEHWWELRACAYYDEFNQTKIVYPEIAKESRFTIDSNHYFTNKTCFIIPREDYYLLTVLNSRVTWFYLSRICPSLGDPGQGGRLNLQTVYVETTPIPRISFTTPKKTREKLTRQLIALSEQAIGGGKSDEEIRKELQPVIELARKDAVEKSDVIHDFLAHLAEQMIAMNKEKQGLAGNFFTWMSDYGIPRRGDMKPKTKLDEFWRMEFKDVVSHLKKNVPLLSISTQDDLKTRFIESSKSLNLLSRKIALTDWLIDQVVYALYGLTAEEIGVVEGKV